MRIATKIILSLLLAMLTATSVCSQERSSAQTYRSSFRYVIVDNGLLHNGRLVLVLLDEKSFSEANLRELFRLISKRFPDPGELHVAVFTSLEQVLTPEEEDFYKSLSPEIEFTPDPNVERYPNAVYIRNGGDESFTYVTVSPTRVERTVVIRGEDLLHPKKKQH